jgi:flagellar biosynthesis/type III secretory pathway M-ring protein FliF/YscJ
MRLGIFVGCLVVVGLLTYFGVVPAGIGKSNPLWVVLLALVVSAPLSYVLLRKQRAAMAEQVAGGVDRAKERLAANRSQEDEAATSSPSTSAATSAEPKTGSA